MCRLLPEDLALALKKVLSLCPIPLLPHIISGGKSHSNYKYGRTIDPAKQWGLVINVFVIRVNSSPPPPLCTPYHEPIVCVIYYIFIQIIVKTSLDLCRTSDDLVCQPDIDHTHR